MSKTNKHRTNRINGIAFSYMNNELGPLNTCPRRGCKGTMTEVWVRYEKEGKINVEKECTLCGKTIKDPRFKEEREKRWLANKERKKKWQNKKNKKERRSK